MQLEEALDHGNLVNTHYLPQSLKYCQLFVLYLKATVKVNLESSEASAPGAAVLLPET